MSHDDLTSRQRDILRLAAAGRTHAAIGRRLNLAKYQISHEIAWICQALHARNTAHAVALGVLHGIVTAEHLEDA